MLLAIIEQNDMDREFWLMVGTLKVNNKVSIADCFAIASAKTHRASVLMSDHHEFDKIAADGVCTVEFIR